MRGLAQRMAGNEEQRRALREHNRKFRLTVEDRRKLAKALEYLTTFEQPVSLALQDLATRTPLEVNISGGHIRTALRLLVEGPRGEFR